MLNFSAGEIMKCPVCNSEDIAEYVVGRPVKDDSCFIFMGCFEKKDMPVYHCNNCKLDFDADMKIWGKKVKSICIQKLLFVCRKLINMQ